MLSKEKLREDFSGLPDRYYTTKTFKKEGFERRQCKICRKYFWTADPQRELCGDPSHEPYSFMKKKPKAIEYAEFWKRFAKFFEKNGHEIIERYPVVSRWRQDLYFTIASIQDFQRFENNRISFEYNANPLLVPQICMRFNDIANVGLTGRHMTSFMMAGQHAFNYPKAGYWRDRTIELNYLALTELLGMRKKELTYIEDVWAMGDFSEFGPCLEFFANGLELGNNVFTQFESSGDRMEELSCKVVDVGWGFERMMWYYCGTDTIYDAVFPKELSYIYKNTGMEIDRKLYAKAAAELGQLDATESKNATELEIKILERAGVPMHEYYTTIKPMQASYAITDHARSLLFAVSDGALPSNVGGGYNLRIILRRLFDFMQQYKIDIDIMKLIELHARDLKPLFKDIDESIGEINEVISVERKRYDNTKSQALKIVTQMLTKNEEFTDERARTLYESNGITPDFINSIAESKGIKIEIPEEAYNAIIKGDFAGRRKEKKQLPIDTTALPKTDKLYYKHLANESHSKVIECDREFLVLDSTPFYPEGGGQDHDSGTINGIKVNDVQNIDGVIVHIMERHADLKKGASAHCIVDKERRARLMAHHTATHLISAAARGVLGKHAWQEGAHKGPNKAHIDISHYERLSEAEIQEIENRANSYITHGIKVVVQELDRNTAESKFGFSIYQGHGVPAKRLRVVQVYDLDGNLIDAEACGGLHVAGMESMVGIIKIISSSRIHDGINRIEFVAGPAAQDYINSMGASIDSISKAVGFDRDKIHAGIASRMQELESIKHELLATEGTLAKIIATQDFKEEKEKILIKEMPYRKEMLRSIGTIFIDGNKERAVVLRNAEGEIIAISGYDSGTNAIELAHKEAKRLGKEFRGGGGEFFAQGRLVSAGQK